MSTLTQDEIIKAVKQALEEDVGTGDATTLATIPVSQVAKANMTAREPLVLAGIAFAEQAFRSLSSFVVIQRCAEDGQRLEAGQVILCVQGPAQAVLSAERVALNFVQRLSGIATLTAQYVKAIQGTRAWILDTRKTTPGWRRFEKYAVICGGGHNHRFGLYDQILIKDNHLVALRGAKPNPVAAAVRQARTRYPHLKVEVDGDTSRTGGGSGGGHCLAR
jgi:nicotinate-nucleotide pyrophosphorylase (carboxylating)